MNNNKVLSSLSLYTELYNSQKYKSQYQILGSFIRVVIVEEDITSFSLSEINYHLEDKFGFNLPSAVVKTALKKIKEIELKHGRYYVNKNIILESEIKGKIQDTQKNIDEIVKSLKKYAKENNPDLSDHDLIVLCDEFISFMSLDDDKIQENNKILISKFVMYCEQKNADISKQLDMIRTGGVLYSGLNYNIDEIPHINNKLTIYFATEILFFLVGYDGELFQNLAQELMDLIKDANKKKRIIEIKIFSATKEEIERYFSSAELLISKKEFAYDQNMAMRSIIDRCKTASDVIRKKVNFYKILNSKYGITVEDDFNYYDEKLNTYNLETIDCDEDQLKDLMYLSNINKRRMGNKYVDYLNCEYLLQIQKE
ncbi:MAG: hypothetical protein J6H31_10850 [Butyrivibrio sp.]|nr:hypothetical protein [Butyrivibrio sp.]